MENPYCNSVVFAKGIPISLNAFGHHRLDRVYSKEFELREGGKLEHPQSIDGYVTGLLSTANASIIRI